MIELFSLIDEIRHLENKLGAVATRRAEASESATNAAQAVTEITSKLERLRMTERALSEAGQRLSAMASRALARGLSQSDIQDALQPLALKSQIQSATGLLIAALDGAANDSLTLQRLASEAKQEVQAVEAEFVAAEDTLEALRDDLRILQATATPA
jgi:chromosome segregation ATPase